LGAQVEQFCSWGSENTVLLYLSFPTNRIALYQACLGRENEEELVYKVPRKPLVAQSLKIEFSHNNCALQEVFFFGHEFDRREVSGI